MGLAYGYDFSKVKLFVDSLVNCSFKGDLVIIANKNLVVPQEYLSKINIIVIDEKRFQRGFPKKVVNKLLSFKPSRPLLNLSFNIAKKTSEEAFLNDFINSYAILSARNAFYYKFLKQKKYANILLADIRDVVFQRDPFEDYHGTLSGFQEALTIKEESYNSFWIKLAFGIETLERIGDNKICCAGTIMGSYEGIMNYLECFLETYIQHEIPTNIFGIDQGVFNYIINSDKLKGVDINENGPRVLTISQQTLSDIKYQDGKLYFKGHLPAVVHQYDRFPELVSYLETNIIAKS